MVGTFAFVASQNLEKFGIISATPCAHEHVNHYAEVTPTLYKSGVSEYWVCCSCHISYKDAGLTEAFENTSGNPTDPTDGRYLAPLGESVEYGFRGENVAASSEAAPAGYAFTEVYQLENANIRNQFATDTSVEGVLKVSFAAKTATKYWASRGDWLYAPGYWYVFELENTAVDTWNITVYTATSGATKKTYTALTGNSLSTLLNITSENDTSYVTNLRVLRDASNKGIAEAAVEDSELVNDMGSSLLRFKQVSHKTLVGGDNLQGKTFIDNPILDGVTFAEFAFLTMNRPLCNNTWAIGLSTKTWYLAKFTVAAENDVSCSIYTLDGTVKFSYEHKTSFAASLPYYNFSGNGEDMEFYSTEIRSVVNKTITTTKIDECAFSSNGVKMDPAFVNAPHGFEQVSHWRNDEAAELNGVYYSGLDLSGYATVTFAAKTTGYFLLNNWSDVVVNKWIVFELTNNGNNKWNLEVTYLDGTTVVTAEDLIDLRTNEDQFKNHALNTILKLQGGTGYQPSKRNNYPFRVWATELRATLA